MARDLKLVALLEDKTGAGIDQLVKKLESANRRIVSDEKKTASQVQKASKESKNRVEQDQKELLRATLQTNRARAHAANNLFDRQRGMETSLSRYNRQMIRVRHGDSVAGNRLLQAERERHSIKMTSIAAREAKFAETPFQTLLARLSVMAQKATGIKVAAVRQMATAMATVGPAGPAGAAGMMGMAGPAGMAGAAGVGAAGGAAGVGAAGGVGGMGMRGMLMAGAGIGVGIGAYMKLRATLQEATRAYENQLRADLKLQAAINATGNTAGGTAVQMSRLASEIQKQTGIGDEAIQGAMAMALQFDKIGRDVFPRAIRAATDLSAFMGMDVSEAMRTVGRAIQDPLNASRALRQANIFLTDSEKARIKSMVEMGQQAEVTALMLTKFEERFKGAANEMALESDKLNARWSDAMERMGKATEGWRIGFLRARVAVAEAMFPTRSEEEYEAFLKRISDPARYDKVVSRADAIKKAAEEEAAALAEWKRQSDEFLGSAEGRFALSSALAEAAGKPLPVRPPVALELSEEQLKQVADIEKRLARLRLEARHEGMQLLLEIEKAEHAERLAAQGTSDKAKERLEEEHTLRMDAIRKTGKNREETEINAAREREIAELRRQQERELADARAFDEQMRQQTEGNYLRMLQATEAGEEAILAARQRIEREGIERQIAALDMVSIESIRRREELQARLTEIDKIHIQEREQLARREAVAQTQRLITAYGQLADAAMGAGMVIANMTNNTRAQRYLRTIMELRTLLQAIMAIQQAMGIISGASGGGGVSDIGSFLQILGGLLGGRVPSGSLSGVGGVDEKGLYKAQSPMMGTSPQALMKGGDSYSINVSVPASVSPGMAQQVGREIGEGVISSLRKHQTATRNADYLGVTG